MGNIANQPWTTILLFVTGYIGFHVANTGMKNHLKAIDVSFSTLIFGFFSMIIYEFVIQVTACSVSIASLTAVIIAVILGAIWRRLGRQAFQWALRITKVSESDDLPGAWYGLFDQTKYDWTQISVNTKDGALYSCKNTVKFGTKPNGPCTLGPPAGRCRPGRRHLRLAGVSPEGWESQMPLDFGSDR